MTRQSYRSGDLVDGAALTTLEAQGIRVFADTAARDTAMPAGTENGMCWIITGNLLQRWDGTKWRVGYSTPAGVLTDTPLRSLRGVVDESVPPHSWQRSDTRATPAALAKVREPRPAFSYQNPFNYPANPRAKIYDNPVASGGGVIEVTGYDQFNLTARVDCDVQIIAVSPGRPGRNDGLVMTVLGRTGTSEPHVVYRYRPGGGGGGGEIDAGTFRLTKNTLIVTYGINSLHNRVYIGRRVVLSAATGRHSPCDGAGFVLPAGTLPSTSYGLGDITGPEYDYTRPTPEYRFGRYTYRDRIGGRPYWQNPVNLTVRGTAGCGATVQAPGADGNARTRGRQKQGGKGVNLDPNLWPLNGGVDPTDIGRGGYGTAEWLTYQQTPTSAIDRSQDTAAQVNPDAAGIYGHGGSGGLPAGVDLPQYTRGADGTWSRLPDAALASTAAAYPATPGGPGAILIRYSARNEPLIVDTVLDA